MGASASPDLALPKQTSTPGKHPERLTMPEMRRIVWERDRGRDRATGLVLEKRDAPDRRRGEVCHLQSRGSHPERKFDPTNAILLSAEHHRLSDARGGRLLRMTDPETGEPAIDARKPIRFTLYNRLGVVVWTRVR